MLDSAYAAKYIGIARMLWEASERDPSKIPVDYSEYLRHEYSDGSISLASLLPKFGYENGLEDWEFDEAVEILGKVSPEDWPSEEDILRVDVDQLLEKNENFEESSTFSYVEDNLGTAEKVEKVLQAVISSVFGEPIEKVRSRSGKFPTSDNNFLQQSDGTFTGTFQFQDLTFDFEIAPTESGWLTTYRLSSSSLDGLPPIPFSDDPELEKKDHSRARARGWK